MTAKQAVKTLMDYRLDSLALLKTLDRAGVKPERLDASLMMDWADTDALLLQTLAASMKKPENEQIPDSITSQLLQGVEIGKTIKQSLIDRLPKRYRKKVGELLPVGKLVVDEDDVHAELAEFLPAR